MLHPESLTVFFSKIPHVIPSGNFRELSLLKFLLGFLQDFPKDSRGISLLFSLFILDLAPKIFFAVSSGVLSGIFAGAIADTSHGVIRTISSRGFSKLYNVVFLTFLAVIIQRFLKRFSQNYSQNALYGILQDFFQDILSEYLQG